MKLINDQRCHNCKYLDDVFCELKKLGFEKVKLEV